MEQTRRVKGGQQPTKAPPVEKRPPVVEPPPEPVALVEEEPVRAQPVRTRPLIEVGQSNVFTGIANPNPEAVIFACVDPHFWTATLQFIQNTLGLGEGEYIPMVFNGGGGPLARPDMLPKEYKFVRDRIVPLLKHYPSIKRIIVINHEDCLYYQGLCKKLVGVIPPFHVHLPLEDLKQIARVIAPLLLGVQLEMYYAKYGTDHTKVVVVRVA